MEIIYFIGALILLAALICGSWHHHARDRRKDRLTDQLVRDRYHHRQS
jgi:hypothetical protein